MCDLPFDLWVVMSLVAHFQNFDGDHALRAWAVIPKEEITAVSITFGRPSGARANQKTMNAMDEVVLRPLLSGSFVIFSLIRLRTRQKDRVHQKITSPMLDGLS